jgi:hypothetical protein
VTEITCYDIRHHLIQAHFPSRFSVPERNMQLIRCNTSEEKKIFHLQNKKFGLSVKHLTQISSYPAKLLSDRVARDTTTLRETFGPGRARLCQSSRQAVQYTYRGGEVLAVEDDRKVDDDIEVLREMIGPLTPNHARSANFFQRLRGVSPKAPSSQGEICRSSRIHAVRVFI